MRKVLSNFKCPQTNKKCRKDWSQIIIGGQNTWKSLKKESSKYSKDAPVSQTGCFYCVPASPGTEWKTPKGREKCTDALYPPTSTSSPRSPFGASEICLRDRMAKTSLTFLPPNWKPGDPQERGRRAEGAPEFGNGNRRPAAAREKRDGSGRDSASDDASAGGPVTETRSRPASDLLRSLGQGTSSLGGGQPAPCSLGWPPPTAPAWGLTALQPLPG